MKRLNSNAARLRSECILSLIRQGFKQREVASALQIKRSLVAYYTATRQRLRRIQ